MLYCVEDLLSNDISVSAMVLNVVQMDMTKIHSRINQNIVDRTVDVVLSRRVILETVYFFINACTQ